MREFSYASENLTHVDQSHRWEGANSENGVGLLLLGSSGQTLTIQWVYALGDDPLL